MCLPTRQDGPLRRHAPVYSNKNVQQQNVFVVSSFHPPLNKFKVSKVYSEKKNCKQKDKLENVLKAWQGTGPGPWPRGRENSRSRAAQTRATPARGRARGNRHSAELTGARATQKKGGETDNTARERQEQTSHQRAAHRQNKCAADGSV